MLRRLITSILLLGTLALAFPVDVAAQCPMCRSTMESNLDNGGTAGRGLNKGILYLFATPYLIIGGIGYVWYRNRRNEAEDAVPVAELN